ncbi:MAG: hypothetical protein GY696_20455 [Gammaproteobacteria bacterium]|nr:hypothetical protein [Gammaproteobacteria bacterium]
MPELRMRFKPESECGKTIENHGHLVVGEPLHHPLSPLTTSRIINLGKEGAVRRRGQGKTVKPVAGQLRNARPSSNIDTTLTPDSD